MSFLKKLDNNLIDFSAVADNKQLLLQTKALLEPYAASEHIRQYPNQVLFKKLNDLLKPINSDTSSASEINECIQTIKACFQQNPVQAGGWLGPSYLHELNLGWHQCYEKILEAKVSHLEHNRAVREKKLEEENHLLKQSVAELKNSLRAEQTTHTSQVERLERENNDYLENAKSAEQQITALKTAHTELQLQYTALQDAQANAIQATHAKNENLQSALDRTTARANKLAQEVENKRIVTKQPKQIHELASTKNSLKEARAEYEELLRDFASHQKAYDELAIAKSDLQDQQVLSASKLKVQAASIKNLEEQLLALKYEIAESEKKIRDLNQLLAKATTEIKEKISLIEKLKHCLKSIKTFVIKINPQDSKLAKIIQDMGQLLEVSSHLKQPGFFSRSVNFENPAQPKPISMISIAVDEASSIVPLSPNKTGAN